MPVQKNQIHKHINMYYKELSYTIIEAQSQICSPVSVQLSPEDQQTGVTLARVSFSVRILLLVGGGTQYSVLVLNGRDEFHS